MNPISKPETDWDKLYATPAYIYGTCPNRYLEAQKCRFRPGMKALAVGDGEGRNSVWLASQGLNVVAIDLSAVAIDKARRLAAKRKVSIQFECCDLRNWQWPLGEFDLVAAIYLQLPEIERATVHRNIAGCLKEGGLLVLEAFHPRHQNAGPAAARAAHTFYSSQSLRQDFQELQIIELVEKRVVLDEGPMHQGEAEIVQLLAHKDVQIGNGQ